MSVYFEPRAAGDVTDELLALARYGVEMEEDPAGRIAWDAVWDRIDGLTLADGRVLDLGSSLSSPALVAVRRALLAERREA